MSDIIYNASNLHIENGFIKNPNRYYLEEYFNQKPGINADIAPGSADDNNDGATAAQLATMNLSNKNFEILGTNAASSNISFSSTRAGINLLTNGSDNDQVILLPHLDTNQTAWSGIKWGTENQVSWQCAISVADIDNVGFWAGLKLTNVPAFATDDNQAYFFYDVDDSVTGGSLTTNANLHFCYSISGTEYITNLGITVAADTIYKLRIDIDKDRKIKVFVGTSASGTVTKMSQYGLTQTASSTGVTVDDSKQLSLAMANDIDLIPYIGVQSTTGAADTLTVYYEKISRRLD